MKSKILQKGMQFIILGVYNDIQAKQPSTEYFNSCTMRG